MFVLKQWMYLHSSEYTLILLLCIRDTLILYRQKGIWFLVLIFHLTTCHTLLCGILKWVLQTHRLAWGHNWNCYHPLFLSEEKTSQVKVCSFMDWINFPFHHVTQQLLSWVKLPGLGEAGMEGVGEFSLRNSGILLQVKPFQSRLTVRCSQAARPCGNLVPSEILWSVRTSSRNIIYDMRHMRNVSHF